MHSVTSLNSVSIYIYIQLQNLINLNYVLVDLKFHWPLFELFLTKYFFLQIMSLYIWTSCMINISSISTLAACNPRCQSWQVCNVPNSCRCPTGYTGYRCRIRTCKLYMIHENSLTLLCNVLATMFRYKIMYAFILKPIQTKISVCFDPINLRGLISWQGGWLILHVHYWCAPSGVHELPKVARERSTQFSWNSKPL